MGDVSQEEAEGEAESAGGFFSSVWESREWFVGLGGGGRCGRRECGQKKKSGQEPGLEAGKSLSCAPGSEGALIRPPLFAEETKKSVVG